MSPMALPFRWQKMTGMSACDEDSCRSLSHLIRSGRSPLVGGRLVVR